MSMEEDQRRFEEIERELEGIAALALHSPRIHQLLNLLMYRSEPTPFILWEYVKVMEEQVEKMIEDEIGIQNRTIKPLLLFTKCPKCGYQLGDI